MLDGTLTATDLSSWTTVSSVKQSFADHGLNPDNSSWFQVACLTDQNLDDIIQELQNKYDSCLAVDDQLGQCVFIGRIENRLGQANFRGFQFSLNENQDNNQINFIERLNQLDPTTKQSVGDVLSKSVIEKKFYNNYNESVSAITKQLEEEFSDGEKQNIAHILCQRVLYTKLLFRKMEKKKFFADFIDNTEGKVVSKWLIEGNASFFPFKQEVKHFFPESPVGGAKISEEKVVEISIEVNKYLNNFDYDFDAQSKISFIDKITPQTIGSALERSLTSDGGDGYTLPRQLTDFVFKKTFRQYDSEHKDLENITIVDPVVGSGSLLVAAQNHLYNKLRGSDNEFCIDTLIQLTNDNLFGVDLDPVAVHTAAIRLQLPLLAESVNPIDLTPPSELQIKRGNTLLGKPFAFDPPIWTQQRTLSEFSTDECLTEDSDRTEELNKEVRRQIGETIERKDHRIDLDTLRPFHWPIEFPEVFSNGGFDIAVLQTPWSEFEKESQSLLSKYLKSGAQFYLPDSSPSRKVSIEQFFLHRAHDIIKSNGVCGGLASEEPLQGKSSHAVRNRLLRKGRLHSVFQLNNPSALGEIDRRFRFQYFSFSENSNDRNEVLMGDLSTIDPFGSYTPTCVPMKLIQAYSPNTLTLPPIDSERQRDAIANVVHTDSFDNKNEGWIIEQSSDIGISRDADYVTTEPYQNSNPIYRGKNIDHYAHSSVGKLSLDTPEYWTIPESKTNSTKDLLRERKNLEYEPWNHERIVFRRVSSATNERTMVATMLPAEALHDRSLISILPAPGLYSYRDRLALLALINSIPFDYVLRMKVDTHIPQYIFSEMSAPVLSPVENEDIFEYITKRADRLARYGRKFGKSENETIIKQTSPYKTDNRQEGIENKSRKQLRAEVDAAAFRVYQFSSELVKFVLDDFHRVRNPSIMDKEYLRLVKKKFDQEVWE